MVCDLCGITVRVAMLHDKNAFCEDCYLKIKPPMLTLTKHWTNNTLFDPKKRSYICKDLKFFIECGFRVFNHRIFSDNIASPVFKEYITLRYYGNLTCQMIPDFNWPKGRQYCRNFNCYHSRQIQIKRENKNGGTAQDHPENL
jgi:hypothetical protein